jgi:arylsulfatase A-like enzyme
MGLLGASTGIVLGLIEAAFLRLPDFALTFPRPHVPFSFWFFDPLLISLAFGLLGLLAGCLAVLAKSRFPGMVIVACLMSLAGAYLALILRSFPSSREWFIFLREVISPSLFISLVFVFALAALWVTRTPDSPFGALARIPTRLWSLVVLGMITLLALATGISFPPDHSLSSTVHAGSRSKSPNIVLIVWDTTRADHFSSYGYSRNTTPNVDQFAKRGVLFENAISASSWTLPAMSSVFTGLLPHQHGASADLPLGDGPRTLAEILKMGGYQTAGFNANPSAGSVAWGLARGFDSYTDCTSALGYSLDASRLGHDIVEPLSEQWFHHSRFNQYTAHQLNELAYQWLDRHSDSQQGGVDRPFFLFLNYMDAHDNYEVPSPYDRFYGQLPEDTKRLIPAARYGHIELTSGQRQSTIAAYDNALRYIDSQVAELLQFLEHTPGWSNTYVIITADHGEAFGEHQTYTHGWDLYREVLHVPLIVVGPGVPAGVRITEMAQTRRIFSTVLESAGREDDILRQTSLARLWDRHDGLDTPDEPTISELIDVTPLPTQRGVISITTRDWQFIYHTDHHRNRLFHWPTDPFEQQDVLELPENQAIVEQLKGTLFSLVERSYQPWRDTRYLEALSDIHFSPDDQVRASAQRIPTELLLPLAPGAAQSLFPPNPETPRFKSPDEDLLRSLPYGGAQ